MIYVILHTTLLYLIQIMLPMIAKKRISEPAGERAEKAVHNLRESLPVFFVFAVLSVYLNIESNTMVALIWLIFRVAFVAFYVSGINTKPAQESGYEPQPLRSLMWLCSVVCLVVMGVNLI
ncbi:MAG: hypothetical protein HOF74_14605 [Gammaproteobacteria bacterium]|jgi:uncharacterized MAPEG superfamily protein|nr:hypothetical protein [Gammaproteobacteria bacterium]MBT3861058.1 hypothetical protein [Gammaproteobacteria bacterium]MBT3987732.1 hypothetical protein [Gammaproteobacteria bacterium]MBT4255035.1 hypothetical protein [Gammaproteobacteria bacterium]MBT4582688.1 hypothetical protein [Gammaproteobacteria bacterium]